MVGLCVKKTGEGCCFHDDSRDPDGERADGGWLQLGVAQCCCLYIQILDMVVTPQAFNLQSNGLSSAAASVIINCYSLTPPASIVPLCTVLQVVRLPAASCKLLSVYVYRLATKSTTPALLLWRHPRFHTPGWLRQNSDDISLAAH